MMLSGRQIIRLLIYGPVIAWIAVVGLLTWGTMVWAGFERTFPERPLLRPEPVPVRRLVQQPIEDDWWEITAYSHHCTAPRSGDDSVARRAANGRWPVPEVSVAAPPELEFGRELLIEGTGIRVVHDRGHAIRGRRLDLFLSDCESARAYGRQQRRVWVIPADSTRFQQGWAR